MQGLIQDFKMDVYDTAFDHDVAFQSAWSGDPFDNGEWTEEHGGRQTYGAGAKSCASS